MKPELYFENKQMKIAPLGEASSLPDLSGEHILQNHLKFCLDEEDELYEGYGRCKNAYPYRQYNCYTRKLEEAKIKTAVLENAYLKAVFLPEYGGRLWELWDKETGQNVLYTNDVLRFSNLAVRNAWFSGGVEWNVGVIGHTPRTTEQMYTGTLTDDKGNPVLRIYEYERIRKVTYQVDFWMEEEEKNLFCRMRIVNESPDVIPMYWWSNIAVPEYENGHIIVPAEEAYTYMNDSVHKVDIPLVEGIDVTEYKNIPKSVDFFFQIPEEAPKYIMNVNENGYGLLQASTKRLKSRKLFSWGNGQASDHWQEFLTEQAGRYVEIQAGLAKTQYGCIPMAPHTAWEWVEQYGAIQIDPELLKKEHKERADILTKQLMEQKVTGKLEERCKATKAMAKREAKLILKGSGFGALRPYIMGTEHLKFEIREPELLQWRSFMETGELGKKNAMEKPGEFCVDATNYILLEKAVQGADRENWYAWYLLGLGYYNVELYDKAEEAYGRAWELEENPWAAHGRAAALLMLEENEKAALWMEKGIYMRKEDMSYLKEGFKLLFMSGAYGKICGIYEGMEQEKQKNGRLKFVYLNALHKLGEDKKAYVLLEEDGGLVVDDIREGEDSVAQLWSELYESVTGEKGDIPYRYDFKAY